MQRKCCAFVVSMVLMMQAFDYEAVDGDGKRRKGTVMAPTARAARREIRAKSLTPIVVKDARNTQTKTSAPKSAGRVKHKYLTQGTRQLAILITSGTPIAEALKITANQSASKDLRTHFLDIRSRVLEGQKMSSAMRSKPKIFNDLYSSLVEAGENSGQLGVILTRLANDMEAAQKVRGKVIGATIYPIVLSVVAICVIVILMVFVVPKVVEQFESFHQELPRLTRAAIKVSDIIKHYGLYMVLGLFIAGITFQYALRVQAFRKWWDKLVLSLPVIGRLIRDLNAARFARTMSGLLSSNVPALQALSIAGNTLGNVILKDAINNVREQVKGGSAVGNSLKSTGVFPPLMGHMISAGESSGDLSEMFDISANYLENEFERSAQIMLSLLEPMIIILLGGMVLLIVAAIFMPILRLNTLSF